MTVAIPLICGDPDKAGGATFSRFVYPFAYKLVPQEEQRALENFVRKGELLYKEEDAEQCVMPEGSGNFFNKRLKARMEYFSHETRQVLFESARWLVMDKEAWEYTEWAQGIVVDSHELCMKPPKIVLFEAKNAVKHGGKEETILRTGFLLVDLYFKETKSSVPGLDDLLRINECFRYFSCPFEGHQKKFGVLFSSVPVTYPCTDEKTKTSGDRACVGSGEDLHPGAYEERWTRLLDFPLQIGGRLFRFDDKEKGRNIYADNRTYVWTAAILPDGIKTLPFLPRDVKPDAHRYGHWIRFLNVDSPKDTPGATHREISAFEREWAKERTYHRWEESGTWYGFSYHSGAMLAGPSWDLPAVRHFQDMYFDMAILLFYVRVTLFRFSRELSRIAIKDDKKQADEYQALRKNFVLFSILYRFPLLSNQQQSIEMYTIAKKYFDIDELYEEVKEEIDTAHQLEEMERQSQSTERMESLAKVGIPIAVAALVASIFGMNADQFPFLKWLLWLIRERKIPEWLGDDSISISFGVLFLLVLFFSLLSFWFVRKFLNKNKKE